MKTVAVFGTFDLLHPGHVAFLQQAKALGDQLVVYLAQDDVIQTIKGRLPVQSLQERKAALEQLPNVHRVIPGDHTLGTYRGISISQPDLIAIGYDQDDLEHDLEKWLHEFNVDIPLVRLEAFHPETYKTSKLRSV